MHSHLGAKVAGCNGGAEGGCGHRQAHHYWRELLRRPYGTKGEVAHEERTGEGEKDDRRHESYDAISI